MKNINDWKIWQFFMDDPNGWTPIDRFQLWFDFWWNKWCCVLILAAYYALAGLIIASVYQLL